MAAASSQLERLHISLSRVAAIRFADQQPLLAELREALQRTRRHATAPSIRPLSALHTLRSRREELPCRLACPVQRVRTVCCCPLMQLTQLRDRADDLRSFRITLEGLATFRNDTGTRSFLSALVNEGKQAVCEAVRAVDTAFAFLGLQTFHKVAILALHLLAPGYFSSTVRKYLCDAMTQISGATQDPRPHVSLAWAVGDCTQTLQHAVDEFNNSEAQQDGPGTGLAWHHQVRRDFACRR